jgi:prephenate dehydrogenase
MDESGFLSAARIAVVGLGLMGGSLAMALHGQCAALYGVDPDPQAVALAIEKRIVDRAACDPAGLLPDADVIILAAPVRAILSELRRLPDLHPGQAVVFDLGSTKRRIVEAMQVLPDRFDPIGGHPMCGKEKGSLANAEAGLFRDAPFALTPLGRTSQRARRLARALALALGARPLELDAETHDAWVGATSHLPYLVANALAAAVPPEARPMAGPGLRSTTRLAPSPSTMMLDILTTNRDHILAALAGYRHRLDALESALQTGDDAGLLAALADGAANYHRLTAEGEAQ